VGADVLTGVSSDGVSFVEAELGNGDPEDVVEQARERGTTLVWVHTNSDLSRFGFSRRSGYVRLHTEAVPSGEALSRLADTDYARTLAGAYRGLWGHRQVAADAIPSPGAVVLGLHDGAEPIGLCRVFPEERLVDGPGLLPEARDAGSYARLLLGACAVLGPGPADLDSWGDSADVISAYVGLGFAVVEQIGGWELRLD
jgi:hypothetical protein